MLFLYNVNIEFDEFIYNLLHKNNTTTKDYNPQSNIDTNNDIIYKRLYNTFNTTNNISIFIKCKKEYKELIILYCHKHNIPYTIDNDNKHDNKNDNDNNEIKDNKNNDNIPYTIDNNNTKENNNEIKDYTEINNYIKYLYNKITQKKTDEYNFIYKSIFTNTEEIDMEQLYFKNRKQWREIRKKIKKEEGLI
ncbi:hypothetical protein SLOPH_1180 [Spraguea lophii 42_110]|uniref:Uncharacterized protein n=1 Tax=Spraguea lophii (strain 42_110) TaxID=1358809 RepID=S7WAN0_SPRLO|nr:hypothetical protein SLOPH_1180 [Spraguea lophii 42_110]